MKKNVTYVPAEKFENIILGLADSGVKAKAQAGWVKVGNFENGCYAYIAKTKRVGRIDLSHFSAEGVFGARKLDGTEKHGSVEWGIDFSMNEDDILKSFTEVLLFMVSLPKVEKVRAPSPMTSKTASKEAAIVHLPSVPEAKEERLDKLEHFKRIAAQYGTTVSQKTEQLLSADDELESDEDSNLDDDADFEDDADLEDDSDDEIEELEGDDELDEGDLDDEV